MIMNFVFLITAYLLGSIPSGLWIGKIFYQVNLRECGSGNTGTTNTFRILGKKAGTIVFICDFLKGTLAALLPTLCHLSQPWSPILFGLAAILGHTYPIFAGFKGGKAVATSAGVVLGFSPWFCLYLIIIFATTLFLTSMVSLASIVASVLGVLGALIFPACHIIFPTYDWLFTGITFFVGNFIILRHRTNLARIKAHTENIVPFGLNLTKQVPTKI